MARTVVLFRASILASPRTPLRNIGTFVLTRVTLVLIIGSFLPTRANLVLTPARPPRTLVLVVPDLSLTPLRPVPNLANPLLTVAPLVLNRLNRVPNLGLLLFVLRPWLHLLPSVLQPRKRSLHRAPNLLQDRPSGRQTRRHVDRQLLVRRRNLLPVPRSLLPPRRTRARRVKSLRSRLLRSLLRLPSRISRPSNAASVTRPLSSLRVFRLIPVPDRPSLPRPDIRRPSDRLSLSPEVVSRPPFCLSLPRVVLSPLSVSVSLLLVLLPLLVRLRLVRVNLLRVLLIPLRVAEATLLHSVRLSLVPTVRIPPSIELIRLLHLPANVAVLPVFLIRIATLAHILNENVPLGM